jgi:hypothetical protein
LAQILDIQTVGDILVINTDVNPYLGLGTAAPTGSIALASDGSGTFTKFGALDTDWKPNGASSIGVEQVVTVNGIGTLAFLTVGSERIFSANGLGALATTPNFGSAVPNIWSPFGSVTNYVTITLGGVILTYTVTVGVQFTLGETVTNGLGAIGVVTAINSATSITITTSVAGFLAGNTITGATSLTVATINVGGVVPEDDYFVCSRNIRSLRFYTTMQTSVGSTSRWRSRIYLNGVNSGTGQYYGAAPSGVANDRTFGVLEHGGIAAGIKISFRIENNSLPASLQNSNSYCVIEYDV